MTSSAQRSLHRLHKPSLLQLLLVATPWLAAQERPSFTAAIGNHELAADLRGTDVAKLPSEENEQEEEDLDEGDPSPAAKNQRPSVTDGVIGPGLEYSKTDGLLDKLKLSANSIYAWADKKLDPAADRSLEASHKSGKQVHDLLTNVNHYKKAMKTYRRRLKKLHEVEMGEVKQDMEKATAAQIRAADRPPSTMAKSNASKTDKILQWDDKEEGGEQGKAEEGGATANAAKEGEEETEEEEEDEEEESEEEEGSSLAEFGTSTAKQQDKDSSGTGASITEQPVTLDAGSSSSLAETKRVAKSVKGSKTGNDGDDDDDDDDGDSEGESEEEESGDEDEEEEEDEEEDEEKRSEGKGGVEEDKEDEEGDDSKDEEEPTRATSEPLALSYPDYTHVGELYIKRFTDAHNKITKHLDKLAHKADMKSKKYGYGLDGIRHSVRHLKNSTRHIYAEKMRRTFKEQVNEFQRKIVHDKPEIYNEEHSLHQYPEGFWHDQMDAAHLQAVHQTGMEAELGTGRPGDESDRMNMNWRALHSQWKADHNNAPQWEAAHNRASQFEAVRNTAAQFEAAHKNAEQWQAANQKAVQFAGVHKEMAARNRAAQFEAAHKDAEQGQAANQKAVQFADVHNEIRAAGSSAGHPAYSRAAQMDTANQKAVQFADVHNEIRAAASQAPPPLGSLLETQATIVVQPQQENADRTIKTEAVPIIPYTHLEAYRKHVEASSKRIGAAIDNITDEKLPKAQKKSEEYKHKNLLLKQRVEQLHVEVLPKFFKKVHEEHKSKVNSIDKLAQSEVATPRNNQLLKEATKHDWDLIKEGKFKDRPKLEFGKDPYEDMSSQQWSSDSSSEQ